MQLVDQQSNTSLADEIRVFFLRPDLYRETSQCLGWYEYNRAEVTVMFSVVIRAW